MHWSWIRMYLSSVVSFARHLTIRLELLSRSTVRSAMSPMAAYSASAESCPDTSRFPSIRICPEYLLGPT